MARAARCDNALKIEFEGFTWPERFLVVSTPFDYDSVFPDLVSVNYFADPVCWYFLLRVGDVWRVMFPIPAEVSDDAARTPEFAQAMLSRIVIRRRSIRSLAHDSRTAFISVLRKHSEKGARSSLEMPRISTIRSAAWA